MHRHTHTQCTQIHACAGMYTYARVLSSSFSCLERLDAAPSDSSSVLAFSPERRPGSPRAQPSLAHGSGSQGQPRVHVHLAMPPPKANPRFRPREHPSRTHLSLRLKNCPVLPGWQSALRTDQPPGPVSSSGRATGLLPRPLGRILCRHLELLGLGVAWALTRISH